MALPPHQPIDLEAAEREEYAVMDAAATFEKFIKTVPEDIRWRVEASALDNSFAVEVFHEYDNDVERWQAALATAQMIMDMGPEDFYGETK